MDNKEISGVKIPKWAGIGTCVAGFIWGILALVTSVANFRYGGGYAGIGVFYLLGGLALVALGVYGLYIANEGNDVRLLKISQWIGAVFGLSWGIVCLVRSNLVSSGSAPLMVIVGLVLLVGAAFVLTGAFRFKLHRSHCKTLDFAFGGAAILVIMSAAAIFGSISSGVGAMNVVGLTVATFLCCLTGLTNFYYGNKLPDGAVAAD